MRVYPFLLIFTVLVSALYAGNGTLLSERPDKDRLILSTDYYNRYSKSDIRSPLECGISLVLGEKELSFLSVNQSENEITAVSDSLDDGAFFTLKLITEKDSYFSSISVTLNNGNMNSVKNDSLQLSLYSVFDSLKVYPLSLEGNSYITKKKKLLPHVSSGQWVGFRSKFWTMLLTPENRKNLSLDFLSDSVMAVSASVETEEVLNFRLYYGPVDRESLVITDSAGRKTDLSALLYHELWFWARWISIGLQKLLYMLVSVVKSYGLAVILLSVIVKLAMIPLVKIADRWQDEVNTTKSFLQPFLDEITKNYKGEEQHNRIMDLYKEHKVSPFYTIKSLGGFFIQVPIFFAAYHTLGEELSLKGVSFLWMKDLASQDHFLKLPFTIFYFGDYLNLLPILMTVITVCSAYIHTDKSLSPVLLKKQRINLYSMAFVFFILFYRFPAAMVLYWTMNNVSAFIKAVHLRFFASEKDK